MIVKVLEYDYRMFDMGSYTNYRHHRGIDQNIFLQKIFVKACVGARGPDWDFPEPK